MKFEKIRKLLVSALSMAMILTSLPANITPVKAAESGTLKSVKSAEADGNVVTITFNDGIQAKLTVLEDDIFRYNVDPSGEFDEYAETYFGYPDTAKIQQYPDDSENYTKPKVKVEDSKDQIIITNNAGKTQIVFDKNTAKMSVLAGGKVVMQEETALQLGNATLASNNSIKGTPTVQRLVENADENFFGGGTQNGRFVHTGKVINIENESSWIDGGVASPAPFYYSTAGYGVLRNTYMDGSYDFGSTENGVVKASHKEDEFDAYYFVSDADNNTEIVQDLLQGYFHVTGNPVLLPQYAFYLGHLNAYNRDMWSADENIGTKWTIKGKASHTSEGTTVYEKGGTGTTLQPGMNVETLNGHGPEFATDNVPEGVNFPYEFSAQARINQYVDNDMPMGFFLPNDGYGAGYGQNGYQMTDDESEDRLKAVEANLKNLSEFAAYAQSHGIATGLWTQSNLTPDTAAKNEQWQLLRDFAGEVNAGVTTLKTDVAWVGYGYSFQLSGTKQAYDIVTAMEYDDNRANTRPNIITLDGWAGSQRYGSIWTGDQIGGKWEYIRFHVPTFIGQSLAGNPNIGCDMDGIWGGSPVISTRDYQWKSFAPQMLDMDGWGDFVKGPFVHGDPYTGIDRMYLKTKAMMMPYIYTNAYAAANIETGNGDKGLPMIRAMFLEFPNEKEAYGDMAKYQYMWGQNLLVAPIYEDAHADELGNDVRNGIYLPGGEDQIWIDYFTGEQYHGGQVLNNFDAPIWKLPLFVKNGAIIPMYAEHNSAYQGAKKGVDKSQRIVEFWPEGNTEFNTIEDDGTFIENKLDDSDKEYGTIDNVSYGEHVETLYKSAVNGKKVTLTAEKSTGNYAGYEKNKDTTFIVNMPSAPTSLAAANGTNKLSEVKVDSKEAFDKAVAKKGTFVSFYDESPAIETFASAEETEIAELVKDVKVSGKLYVKFAKADAQAEQQKLVIGGFEGNTSSTVTGNPFLDITEDQYYYNPILWAYEKGIAAGVNKNHFAPEDTATRAQVMTFLWRANGEPKPKTKEIPFTDVQEGLYYTDAILWAYENGIAAGKGDGTFGTDESIKREDFVSFLYREEGCPVYTQDKTNFKDLESGMYYTDAVLWAVENGITSGVAADAFGVGEDCTRGQIATFLYNTFNLSAPELRDNEEAKTATSITLEWDAVPGAVGYQLELDGKAPLQTIERGGTTYTHRGLECESEHTYRIRSVGKDGVSEWSKVLKASTVENPFLNTPEAVDVIWNGGLYSGRKPESAFDRVIQSDANGFRSGSNDVGTPLIVDYGKAYLFNKIDFYPYDPYNETIRRGDVSKLCVEASLDGVHWIQLGDTYDEENDVKVFERNLYKEDGETLDMEEIARVWTLDLKDPNTGSDFVGARFFRFKKLNTKPDGYFSSNEIQTFALEGETTVGSVWKPFRVGNITSVEMKEASLGSFQLMYQKESSAHGCYKNDTWVGEIQKQYGDINFNGYSDVYDYAFTAFAADGGTTKTGSVAGNVKLVPSAATVKAGETFTVAVTAENVENLNAYGSIMHYDPKLVEYVGVSYDNTAEMYTQGMTGNIINDDGTAYVNHNALNMGDKELINGSMVLSTITMKAKQDITLTDDVLDLSTVTIMGPDFSFVECK